MAAQRSFGGRSLPKLRPGRRKRSLGRLEMALMRHYHAIDISWTRIPFQEKCLFRETLPFSDYSVLAARLFIPRRPTSSPLGLNHSPRVHFFASRSLSRSRSLATMKRNNSLHVRNGCRSAIHMRMLSLYQSLQSMQLAARLSPRSARFQRSREFNKIIKNKLFCVEVEKSAGMQGKSGKKKRKNYSLAVITSLSDCIMRIQSIFCIDGNEARRRCMCVRAQRQSRPTEREREREARRVTKNAFVSSLACDGSQQIGTSFGVDFDH